MSDSDNTVDIVIPDIGDSKDVEIIEILVSAGDQVSVDDSLLTLESDKASMEVPATVSGVIESLSVAVGDTVNSGDVIGRLSAAAATSSKSETATTDEKRGEETTPGSNESSGGQTGASANAPAESSAKVATETSASTSTTAAAKASSSPATSPTAHISDEGMRKAHASPGVRRYAREHGADLSLIKGTGPKGRISKTDVMAFIKQAMEGMGSSYGSSAAMPAGGGAGIPPIPEVDFSKFGEIERVELGRINKLSAANLHRAWLNLPMVTHHDVADVTEMEAFRKQLKAESGDGDPKITGLAFHMKALVNTLQAFPKLNSSLSADGEALFYKHYYHIGIAVDTPNGLVVPVFRDVDKKSITRLAEEMSDVSTRARQKKLKPDEMQGASMTISSLGGIGGTAFTPIVNPPEVAILGITRATMQPVWSGSEFIPRLLCPLDLTYDHRVVDGADAARFMAHYVRQISDIRRLTL
ncbi:MAG: branched-chain alpha-keto acid dehydrogenase subunit E2 [Granulosicoccus sp.]|nr:branched-chain alpha-keto acid dehydrogenase subunit E2 [Granulosicoccus sp.]